MIVAIIVAKLRMLVETNQEVPFTLIPFFLAGGAAYDGGEGEYDDGRSGCNGGDGGGCDSAVVDATAEEVVKIKPISSIQRSVNSN